MKAIDLVGCSTGRQGRRLSSNVFTAKPAQESSAVNFPNKQSKWRDSPVVALPLR